MKIIKHNAKIVFITVITLMIASCNGFGPIKGNGKVVKQEKEVSEFNKINFEGAFNVFISQGEQTKLTIEADENLQDYVVAKIKNKKLSIKTKRNLSPSKEINIYLTVKTFDGIESSGAVIIKSLGKLNADKLSLDMSGASNIALDINCVELRTNITGSSTMKLIGAASFADFDVSGSSEINNFEMIFDDLKLKVKGSSKVKVNVLTKLDVSLTGSGEIEYMGTPDVKKEISGSGSVTKLF